MNIIFSEYYLLVLASFKLLAFRAIKGTVVKAPVLPSLSPLAQNH